MGPAQLKLRLRPLPGGRYADLRITGTVPTSVEDLTIHRLLMSLVHLSEKRVRVDVAFAADDPVGWFVWWLVGLCTVPERHLRMRCRTVRRGGGGGDEPR